MAATTCPDLERLTQYALGTLGEDQVDGLEAHLGACTPCDRTFDTLLAKGDTLLDSLRQPGPEGDTRLHPDVRGALAHVKNLLAESTNHHHRSTPGAPKTFVAGMQSGIDSNDAAGLFQEMIGPYLLQERLGVGGMGTVYRALHTRLDRPVAIKIVVGGQRQNPEIVARFEQEMRAIGKLDHPNLIRAFDAGEGPNREFFYLAMELVEGMDVGQHLKSRANLPIDEACAIARQAALGLEYIHQQGQVHRDIKPSNLMLTPDGTVKILDLGLALLHDAAQEDLTSRELTSQGQVMGTLDYMAPEQGGDSHLVDSRADVYSLGCTLFALLTGHPPFAHEKGSGILAKLRAHEEKTPPDLVSLRPEVSPALAALVGRMLAKSPEDRPASAAEVAKTLDALAAGATTVAAPSGTQRRPMRMVYAVAAGLLFVVGGVLLMQPTILRIFDRNGKEIGKAIIPEGGKFTVDPPEMDPVQTRLAWMAGKPGPLDTLRRQDISPDALAAAGFGNPDQAPAELVAVLGDSRLRHAFEVNYLSHLNEGDQVVAASLDGTVVVWDARTGRASKIIHIGDTSRYTHSLHQANVGAGRKYLAAFVTLPKPKIGYADPQEFSSSIKILDLKTCRVVGNIDIQGGGKIAVGSDGKRLAMVNGNTNLLRLWDVPSGRRITLETQSFENPTAPQHGLAFDPEGKTLVHCGPDGILRMRDAETGKELHRLPGNHQGVKSMAISPNGKILATSRSAGEPKVILWDLATRKEIRTLDTSGNLVFSPDGKKLAVGAEIWDVASGRKPSAILAGPMVGDALTFTSDGKKVATSGGFGTIRFWDATTGEPCSPMTDGRHYWTMEISPDGRTLAAGGGGTTIDLWDIPSRRIHHSVKDVREDISALAFSPDGSKLVFQPERYKKMCVWDVKRKVTERTLSAGTHHVIGFDFAEDGRNLVVGGAAGNVTVFSVPTWAVLRQFQGRYHYGAGQFEYIRPVAFLQDGTTLAMVNRKKMKNTGPVRLVDSVTGETRKTLGNAYSYGVAVSPDGKTLASMGSGGSIHLFDPTTGEATETLHQGGHLSMDFSPDGKALASPSKTTWGILLWDLSRIRGQQDAKAHEIRLGTFVRQVRFAPDGRHLLVRCYNGLIHVLRLGQAAGK